jgi:hypothetical protein
LSAVARHPWWRSLLKGGDASDDDGTSLIVTDPTSELLRQITRVESRIPWNLVGILVVAALWLPTLPLLLGPWDGVVGTSPPRAGVAPSPERSWVERTLEDAPRIETESALVRRATREAWNALGVEAPPGPRDEAARRLLRAPSAAFSLLGLVVLFLLARAIAGNAAGLLAASLAAIAVPWIRAGTSALPLMVGETLTLAGIARAVAVQARHREVEVPGISARRIGGAGIVLGFGLLFAPANFAPVLAVLIVWLFLALRRTSSERTTLPVSSPGETAFFAIAGAVVMVGALVLVGWGAERLAGGNAFPFLAGFGGDVAGSREIYRAIHGAIWRGLFSPSVATDRLIYVAVAVIAVLRFLEWSAGKPWRAAGLFPWLFFALYVLTFVRGQADPSVLVVPLTVPPLFVLGVGWLVLRGLRPGRAHRQEYSFLLVWLGLVLATVPLIPATHVDDPKLAAFLTLLPPVVIVAGRAGRAMWESDEQALARVAVFLLLYLPIASWIASEVGADFPGTRFAALAESFSQRLPVIVLGTIVLGVLSELIGVRPDPRLARRAGRRPGRGPSRGDDRKGGRSGATRRGGSKRRDRGTSGRSSRRGSGGDRSRRSSSRREGASGGKSGKSGRPAGRKKEGRREGRRGGRRGGGR